MSLKPPSSESAREAAVDTASLRLEQALYSMTQAKPNDRSDEDRAVAILLTNLEQVAGLWMHWIVDGNYPRRKG